MEQGTLVQLGKEFPLFEGKKLKGIESGCVFEALENNNGYSHSIYLRNMTKHEIKALGEEKISVRVIEGMEGCIMTLFKYGVSPLIFEVEFDPTLYKDSRAMQLKEETNFLYIYGIESTTNIVKSIRTVTISPKLREKWIQTWEAAFKNENFTEEYKTWCDKLRGKYTTNELWDSALPLGQLGE